MLRCKYFAPQLYLYKSQFENKHSFIHDITESSSKFSFILYADDTTLNSILDTCGTNQVDIEKSIIIELQNILKWLDVNKLCLNVSKSKFMLFHMPQKVIPCLSFIINGLQIENSIILIFRSHYKLSS